MASWTPEQVRQDELERAKEHREELLWRNIKGNIADRFQWELAMIAVEDEIARLEAER